MKKQLMKTGACLILLLSSCLPKNDKIVDLNDSSLIPTIEGRAYLQPLDKVISLSFASSKTTVFFDFIDSTYCNITINSAVGNIVQSRKYSIDSTRVLTLTNPLNDNEVKYKIAITPDTSILLSDNKGKNLYTLIPCGNQVNMLLISENQLKKQEFLYPTLTEKEREFGAENQYIQTDDGRFISKPHPLRNEVSKVNIYKLF